MGAAKDFVKRSFGSDGFEGILDPSGKLPTIGDWTGQTAADASLAAAQLGYQGTKDALDYQKQKDALARSDLMPFVGNSADLLKVHNALLNPQVQAAYLQANPMFQAAIDKSNTGFKNTLGFSGKRGDLQNAITQNYMATGQNYVNNALDNLWRPIQLGQNSAAGTAMQAQNSGAQGANLITGGANALAAGQVGAANAQQAGMGNLLQVGGGLLGAFMMSDERTKEDIQRVGETDDGLPLYRWRYKGDSEFRFGPMAQEVEKMQPEASAGNINGVKLINPLLVH